MNEPLDPLKRSAYLLTLKCGPDATREEIERNYLDLCCKLRAIAEKNSRLKPVTDKEIAKLTEAYEALIREPVTGETVWFETPEQPTENDLTRQCEADAAEPKDEGAVKNAAEDSPQSEPEQEGGDPDPDHWSDPPGREPVDPEKLARVVNAVGMKVFFLDCYVKELQTAVEALKQDRQGATRRQFDYSGRTEKELKDFKATCAFLAVGLVLFLAAWLSHYDHLQADHKRLADKYESQERSLVQGEGFKMTRPAVAIDLVPTDRPGIPLAPVAPTSKIDPAWFSKTKPIRVDWRPRLSEDPASMVARQWNRLEQERKQGRALARYADWLRAYDDWKLDNPEATSGEETQFMRDWYEQWDREHPEPENPVPDFS